MSEVYFNLIAICLITLALGIFIYSLLRGSKHSALPGKNFSYDYLRDGAKRMINNYAGAKSLADLGVSRQTQRKLEQQGMAVSRYLRTCCSGDDGAREALKELIRYYLDDVGVNESTVYYAIPFNHPENMTARQMAESLIYYFDNNNDLGFSVLHERYGWGKAVPLEDGSCHYEIDESMVRRTWNQVQPSLSFSNQLDILTQLIYSDNHGLGILDVYNQQKGCIEEIQLGMTGRSTKIYDYKNFLMDAGNGDKPKVEYSYDSFHLIIRGFAVRLSFLSCESENEQQRILRNLIKNSTAGELTVKNPLARIESPDGGRITVTRPPVSTSWAGFIRKADNIADNYSLEKWCKEMRKNSLIAEFVRQLVHTGFNIGITGEYASGKSLFLRCCLAETRNDFSVRIIEAESLEVDDRRFLPGRNSISFRISETTPVNKVLALLRKTTGHVFCIGEVDGPVMAVAALSVAKVSRQMLFTGHDRSTQDMVSNFKSANLREGGFSNEIQAEMDAVSGLGFDIHLQNVGGVRFVQSINEIIPNFDLSCDYKDDLSIPDSSQTVSVLRDLRTQMGKKTMYTIREILKYDVTTGEYQYINQPSERCFLNAKEYMPALQYKSFVDFFENRVHLLTKDSEEEDTCG